jgi:hypothetical protein
VDEQRPDEVTALSAAYADAEFLSMVRSTALRSNRVVISMTLTSCRFVKSGRGAFSS